MNIVSALFRAVGRHGHAHKDYGWQTLGRFTDDRQTHRHGDSRFLYPPSCMHVHFEPSRSQDRVDATAREQTSIIEGRYRYR
jgi:hypothetical protein